jgi:hypothetical protein
MSLIVEDGTGKADAESYISVADATTYHAARGNADWANAASDAVREQALRKATDFMTQRYQLRWAGYKLTITQALDWPRSYVKRPGIWPSYYERSDVVPVEVQRACAELALRVVQGTTLAPDLQPQVESEQVGPIKTTYARGARQDTEFQVVDMGLSALLVGGNGARVLRA